MEPERAVVVELRLVHQVLRHLGRAAARPDVFGRKRIFAEHVVEAVFRVRIVRGIVDRLLAGFPVDVFGNGARGRDVGPDAPVVVLEIGHRAERKPLRHEIEFLIERERGVDVHARMPFETAEIEILHGVVHRVSRFVVGERPVLVAHRILVGTLGVDAGPQVGRRGGRRALDAPRAVDIHADRRGGCGLEIEVRTEVEALVVVLRDIALAEVLTFEHVAVVHVGQRAVVLDEFRTAPHVECIALRPRMLAQHLALPVDVGIEVGVVAVAVAAQDLGRRIFAPEVSVHRDLILDGLVPVPQSGIRIGVLGQFRRHFQRDVGRCREGRAALLAAFGGDEDHAVAAPHAEHGRRRSVFQHRDVLDFAQIDVVHAAFDAVDEHQRRSVVPGRNRADEDLRIVLSRFSGVVERDEARHQTGQGARNVRHAAGLHQFVALHLRNGSGDALLGLFAVSHDDHVGKHRRGLLQRDVQRGFRRSVDRNLDALQPHVREDESFAGGHVDDILTVEIGRDASHRPLHDSHCPDHRSGRVADAS